MIIALGETIAECWKMSTAGRESIPTSAAQSSVETIDESGRNMWTTSRAPITRVGNMVKTCN